MRSWRRPSLFALFELVSVESELAEGDWERDWERPWFGPWSFLWSAKKAISWFNFGKKESNVIKKKRRILIKDLISFKLNYRTKEARMILHSGIYIFFVASILLLAWSQWCENDVYSSTNKTRFHNKGFALSQPRFENEISWNSEMVYWSNYYIINVFGIVWFRIIMFIERLCAQTCRSKLIFKLTVHPSRVCVTY